MEGYASHEGGQEAVILADSNTTHLIAIGDAQSIDDEEKRAERLEEISGDMASEYYEMSATQGVSRCVYKNGADGVARFNGRTHAQVAFSGHQYCSHKFAHERVDVEVAEVLDGDEKLVPGMAKITISPKASRRDASPEEAKQENVDDRDMVRITYLNTDEEGNIIGKTIESISVFNVPLSTWAEYLTSSENILGRPIELDDPESALSVMKTHSELYVPLSRLPDGPISVLEDAARFLGDAIISADVEGQIRAMREADQEGLKQQIDGAVLRAFEFYSELDASLRAEQISEEVKTFINSHLGQVKGQYKMALSEAIASGRLDEASTHACCKLYRYYDFLRMGVVTGNKDYKEQLGQQEADDIVRRYNFAAYNNVSLAEYHMMMSSTNEYAKSLRKVGGGCSGSISFEEELANVADKVGEGISETQEEKYSFSKYMHCVACDPKKEHGKTMCGPCGICKTCDSRMRSKAA